MAEDSVAAGDNILAMLIEMGEATFDQATVALEKSGGNEKKALDMLMRGAITMQSAKPSKPPKSVCSKVDGLLSRHHRIQTTLRMHQRRRLAAPLVRKICLCKV